MINFFRTLVPRRLSATLLIVLFTGGGSAWAKPAVEWQPGTLDIRQMQGTQSHYSIDVTVNQNATDVIARITPALEPWITVSPLTYGDIQSGQTLTLDLIVSIPSQEITGKKGGVLQLRGGKNQKNLSKPLPLSLTIIPKTEDGLPPDPGEAGKETLLGIDSDMDGVRDDVQRYIVLTYPDQPNLQQALFQVARSYTETFQTGLSEEEAYEISLVGSKAIFCLRYFDWRAAGLRLDLLNAEILNTMARSRQYLLYDALLGGMTFSLPDVDVEEYWRFCEFEIVE
jgi:hypothetical protein